jgi:site-specific recombinase XerD
MSEGVSRPAGVPDWAELAEDWLAAKRVGRRSDDAGHADRARRGDLIRWAEAINTVSGRHVDLPSHSLAGWGFVMTELSDETVMLRALDLISGRLAVSSTARALSTLRGFCGFLVRRGALAADPTASPELMIRLRRTTEVRGLTVADVEALELAARLPVIGRERTRWASRDLAIVGALARAGLRVSELCALTLGSIDRNGEQTIVRVREGSKGGRHRDVPLPHQVDSAIDAYLVERSHLPPTAVLFVRHNETAMNQQFVDTLLRRLCVLAGVQPPEGAMAHALRHTYGSELARRGVPVMLIQQLLGHTDPRTSSIYTTVHLTDLTHTLREAGLL